MNSSDSEFYGFSDEEPDSVVKIVYSQKNKEMLCVDGYLYNSQKKKNGKYYWECAQRKHCVPTDNQCKGRVVSEVKDGVHKVRSRKEHIHDPNPLDFIDKNYRSQLKKKATDCSDIPSKIVREVSAVNPQIVQTRVTKFAQKMIVHRAREKQLRNRTAADDDGETGISEESKKTIDGQPFLQTDTVNGSPRIWIFATHQNLQRLQAAEYWLVDGTFSSAPLQFYQLYSIHAPVGQGTSRRILPLVYILLGSKTQEIYIEAFETLLDISLKKQIPLKPRYVLLDFEKAVINAIKEVLPETECFGCYFHFVQSLIRQLNVLGFKREYSNELDIFMSIKKLQALTFLPANRIVEAYKELKPAIPSKLTRFIEYFEQTYVLGRNGNGRPLFHPSLWSNYKSVIQGIPRSTNLLEAWHRRWSSLVGTHHLSIIKLVDELRKEQHETEGKILCILKGDLGPLGDAEHVKMDLNIYQKCSTVDADSNEDFIEGMALCLAAKTKRT